MYMQSTLTHSKLQISRNVVGHSTVVSTVVMHGTVVSTVVSTVHCSVVGVSYWYSLHVLWLPTGIQIEL